MTDFLQVITTVDDKEAADNIARHILEQQLAACVQITPCRSIYRWQGRVEKTDEYFCIIKTRTHLYSELEQAIKQIHPYEVPEIIATEISQGSKEYLDWLDQELRSDFKSDKGE